LLRPHVTRGFFYPVRVEALNPFSSTNMEWLRSESDLLGQVENEDANKEAAWLAQQIDLNEQRALIVDGLIGTLTPAQRQAWACRSVYMTAFTAGAVGQAVETFHDATLAVEAIREGAWLLEQSAAFASKVLGRPFDVQEPLASMKAKAQLQLLRAKKDRLFERQTADASLRAFAMKLQEAMKNLFGTFLYGQIATISNVVFDRNDVKQSHVREIVRFGRLGGNKRRHSSQ
jgi:hypothetical protein